MVYYIKMNIQTCYNAVEDMQEQRGEYWIKRQQNLFNAIRKQKGRFKEMSDRTRLKMMKKIEIDVFGESRIAEQEKQEFLNWFKKVFCYNYNEM